MAYIDFETVGYATPNLARPIAPAELSSIELSVVHLSLRDSRRSIRPLGVAKHLLRAVFGTRPTTRLADPRLEALRAYAVNYRTMRRNRKSDLEFENGVAELGTEAMAETRRIVDAYLARLPQRRLNTKVLAGVAVVAPVALWIFTSITRELGDPLISFILTVLMSVTAVSLALPRQQRR